jgi:glycine cleavage system H protein
MVKEGLYYTETHEWVRIDGEFAYFGISDYAQHELGDIVYVELPAVGDETQQGEPFGSVEAVKSVEDLNAPMSGEVVEVNEYLEANPEFINKEPREIEIKEIKNISYKDKICSFQILCSKGTYIRSIDLFWIFITC